MRRMTEGYQPPTPYRVPLLQMLCFGLFLALLVGSWAPLTLAQVSSSGPPVPEPLKAEAREADPIIISVTAPPGLSTLIGGAAVVTSWSQSTSHTGVSIAVLLDAALVGQTPSAHAYLTTRIGPGTTAMDEIAHTRVTVPTELPVCSPGGSCGAMVTLFSDLRLGPGTYFVTLSPDATSPPSSGAVGWFPALNPTVVAASGVSEGASLITSAVAAYPPASAFGGYPFAMNLTVTGTAAFAGTPGKGNCYGKSVVALVRQFGGLHAAASALGFPSEQALKETKREFCED
jgi:hypothetical protein